LTILIRDISIVETAGAVGKSFQVRATCDPVARSGKPNIIPFRGGFGEGSGNRAFCTLVAIRTLVAIISAALA